MLIDRQRLSCMRGRRRGYISLVGIVFVCADDQTRYTIKFIPKTGQLILKVTDDVKVSQVVRDIVRIIRKSSRIYVFYGTMLISVHNVQDVLFHHSQPIRSAQSPTISSNVQYKAQSSSFRVGICSCRNTRSGRGGRSDDWSWGSRRRDG